MKTLVFKTLACELTMHAFLDPHAVQLGLRWVGVLFVLDRLSFQVRSSLSVHRIFECRVLGSGNKNPM